MKKRACLLLALVFLALAGCSTSAASAFKFRVAAYAAQPKEVPVYAATIDPADITLDEDTRDWAFSTLSKYDEIMDVSYLSFTKLANSPDDRDTEWYDLFLSEAALYTAKCNNFLKLSVRTGMKDLKTLADIQVTGVYNGIEALKEAASKGDDAGYAAAQAMLEDAFSNRNKPFNYLESLYDRYPFKIALSSMSVKNSATRLFVRFKNNDTATITEFTFYVQCRNKDHQEVLFEGTNSFMKCVWTKANLKPGKVTGSQWYWKVGAFDSGKYEYRVLLVNYSTSDGRVVVCNPDSYEWSEWKH